MRPLFICLLMVLLCLSGVTQAQIARERRLDLDAPVGHVEREARPGEVELDVAGARPDPEILTPPTSPDVELDERLVEVDDVELLFAALSPHAALQLAA